MRPTVYLDSSVPSYWLPQGDDPVLKARHLQTRRWWSAELPRFDAYVSKVVLDELCAGDSGRARQRLELVAELPILELNERVESAAHFYIAHFAMPRKNMRDAFHLALASVHDMEYLVTWNYGHLANASKRTHIETLNRRLHLPMPIICSPEELMLEPDSNEED